MTWARWVSAVLGLIPPGRYRFAFDLVLEGRYWLSEIGNELLGVEVEVGKRDASARVAHVPPEVEPAPEELEAAKTERPERRNGAKPAAGKKPAPSRSGRTPPPPTRISRPNSSRRGFAG